jgi:hypothetical protein
VNLLDTGLVSTVLLIRKDLEPTSLETPTWFILESKAGLLLNKSPPVSLIGSSFYGDLE